MYVDNNLLVSGGVSATGALSGQTVTGTNTNVVSTNAIDLATQRDIGEGSDIYLRSSVFTAVAGATSIEIQAIAADDAALTTNVTVLATTGTILLASLTAGARFATELPPRIASKGQRFLGARYVIVGTGSAGAFMTDFGDAVQDGQKFYPVGFSVL
jgi:predicted RecA/RadA family phage recombinase